VVRRLGLAALIVLACAPASAAAGTPSYRNPVLAGDYPDPSAIRLGNDYWAAVTSNAWRPPFTLLHSTDLVNWTTAGSVLRRAPHWTRGSFWAPEISRNGDHLLVYYSALQRHGSFCVGVAVGRQPGGLFDDRGPVVCNPLGAIDPFPVRDENGRPWLVWKVNGNARGLPTPIMAAPLRADGLGLAGPARELLRNQAPWEGAVIEGPEIVRHGGLFHLIYSVGRCCGSSCSYAVAAARAPTLLGPWERHPGPILVGGGSFGCPGHGSLVQTPDGRLFLLYHAYQAGDPVNRHLMLDRITWTADGWPRIGAGVPSATAPSPLGARQLDAHAPLLEGFRRRLLPGVWRWPFVRPRQRVYPGHGGRLVLRPRRVRGELVPGALGRQPGAASFVAETEVGERRDARAGLALSDGSSRAIGLELRGREATVWRTEAGGRAALATVRVRSRRPVRLRVRVRGARTASFALRDGRRWRPVGGVERAPGWNGPPHVLMRVEGGADARATFESFSLEPAGR
jgi:hypothetical protein